MLTAAETELTARAAFLLAAGEPEGAAWTYHRAAVSALVRGSAAAAQELLDRAAEIVHGGGADAAALGIALDVARAHVERAVGARAAAARLLDDAAARALAVGDEAGQLAVEIARCAAMLADPAQWAEGRTAAARLRQHLPRPALRARWIWLTLALASAHAQAGQADRAADLAAEVLAETAPGTPDHVAAAAIAARAMLAGGQLDDAAATAATALAAPAHGTPVALRAELFVIAAAALLAAGDDHDAAACAAHARSLAPPPLLGALERHLAEPRWLLDLTRS